MNSPKQIGKLILLVITIFQSSQSTCKPHQKQIFFVNRKCCTQSGMVGLASKRVRLDPNWTNPGLFQIRFRCIWRGAPSVWPQTDRYLVQNRHIHYLNSALETLVLNNSSSLSSLNALVDVRYLSESILSISMSHLNGKLGSNLFRFVLYLSLLCED